MKLAVRDRNQAFYDAFERLDLEAMSELWARSAEVTCVHPGWDVLVGYEAIMESWRAIFDGTRDIRLRFDDPRVTVNDALAWVVGRELLFTTAQGMPVENVLTAINAFVLEEGVWRIAHHHAAPILAGRPRVSSAPGTVLH